MACRSLWLSGIACALATAGLPCVAAAQAHVPRVAVGPFTGERAAVTRSVVAGVFANHVGEIELRSQSEYNSAAARLGGANRSDEASVSSVARALGIDDVIVGALERQGTGYRLRLRVLRARDGHSAGSASWEFERVEEINAFANEIWEQLRGSLQFDTSIAQANSASREGSDNHGATPVEPAHETDGTSDARAHAADAPTPGLGWLWIHLGGGLSGRRWRIPLLGETTPRGYENGAFGELRATLAAYYRVNHNRLGVGLEGTVGIPLGLSSQGRGPDGRVVPIATSALELQFGASLAMRPTSGGMFRAFVGMVYHQFSLDTSHLSPEMHLAPVTYVGLRVAGEGTLPIYAQRDLEFGLIFGGELRLAAIGSEMKEAFGANPDTTLAFGSWFGLSFRLDRVAPGLGLRATAEFLRYVTDFAGPAHIGTPGESVDDYTRFLFTVVYAFGTERAASRRAPAGSSTEANTAPPPEENAGNSSGATQPSGDPFGGR